MILFYETKFYRNYDWEAMEGVALYSANYEEHIDDFIQQINYLAFEQGYGCDTSMRMLDHFRNLNTKEEVLNNIVKYRQKYL